MPPPLPPPLPPPRQKTWWERYWPWVAILGGVLLLTLMGSGVFAGFSWIGRQMRGSEGYQRAIATVRADRRVQAALGEPIDDSKSFLQGSVVNAGNVQTVNATVTLNGPKDHATMVVNAMKTNDRWRFETLTVTLHSSHQTFDLSAAANRPDTAPSKSP